MRSVRKKVGQLLDASGSPVATRSGCACMNFVEEDLGKVIPHDVHDLALNSEWARVGTDHDTPAFAVEPIARWWRQSILGDVTEEPMLDLVPFRRARRKVPHAGQARAVREALQFDLPQPGAGTVAPARIRGPTWTISSSLEPSSVATGTTPSILVTNLLGDHVASDRAH